MNKFKRLNASIHEDGVDLISNLPDPVLLLILSGLTSTKESIQTSILSRRWRYLWTSLPSLDLEYDGGGWKRPAGEKSKFKNIVNRALLHRSVNLDSIHLSCSDYFSTSTLVQWIDLTVMRNVKQLDLDFWPKDDMVMPRCLVTCASLEVLRLSLTRLLISPRSSGFPALKVLKLEKIELFVDGLVKYFLEGCPLLEDLTLDDCSVDELNLLYISSPKLKELRFIYPENEYFCGCLKLCCPNLVFLQITGQVVINYIFEGPFSLTEVVIDPNFDISSELFDTISRSFHIISHVESLRTGLYFLYQCIDAACDPALPNLKTLELTTINENYTVKGLKKILKICPKLESLVLTIENVNSYEEEKEDFDETEYPNLDEVGTWNLTPDVAWVEFFELNGKKPKLTNDRYDDNSDWIHVVAKWGKEARFAHYTQ